MRAIGRLVVVVALLTGIAVSPATAGARSTTAVLMMTGTQYPGLGEIPVAQELRLTGQATVTDAQTGVSTVEQCAITGTGIADSKSEGLGSIWAQCQTFTLGTCVYVRVALSIVVHCMETVKTWTGTFVMVPLLARSTDLSAWTDVAWIGEMTYSEVTPDVPTSPTTVQTRGKKGRR